MRPDSQDLRQRIRQTIERGEDSVRPIARRFRVSLSFVVRLLQTHRRIASLQPKPHGGGYSAALGSEDLQRLREWVRQQPDATREELQQRQGVACSTMAIGRALVKLKL